MDELVKLVTQKAGISEDSARTAVETVLNFVKARLPGPIASQIESALGGASGVDLGGLASQVGGLFGKK